MTAQELIDQVRDELADYGDVGESAASDLTTEAAAADTTLYVADASQFDVGDWLYAGFEIMEVSGEIPAVGNSIPVRRAMRGSTAAIHTVGTVVRANLKFSNSLILRTLNRSIAGAFPKIAQIVEDETLTVVEDQQFYDLSATIRQIRSVWIEDTAGSGEYFLCRLAVPQREGVFTLHGSFDAGRGIKVIGLAPFSRMVAGGSLDTDWPDDDEAYAYLVYDAIGRLLYQRAAQMAVDDGAPSRGSQGQDDRYVLLNAAKAMRLEAQKSLNRVKVELPKRVMPRADARYF